MAWFWCTVHDTVETADGCPAMVRLGPYDSPEAARDWQDRTVERDNRWEEADARWEGRPPRYRRR